MSTNRDLPDYMSKNAHKMQIILRVFPIFNSIVNYPNSFVQLSTPSSVVNGFFWLGYVMAGTIGGYLGGAIASTIAEKKEQDIPYFNENARFQKYRVEIATAVLLGTIVGQGLGTRALNHFANQHGLKTARKSSNQTASTLQQQLTQQTGIDKNYKIKKDQNFIVPNKASLKI